VNIETPAAVVDVSVLDRNITTWADRMAARAVGLRPHTKTSKCAEIISRQVRAGAAGLTVATLGEAEALADCGFDHLFQAYPVWAGTPGRAQRVRALNDRVDLLVGVESTESADALAAAVLGSGRPLGVVLEVDCGMRRSGVDLTELASLARRCLDLGLDVRGAFTYGGHSYANCDAPPAAADDEVRTLQEAESILRAEGVTPTVLSAGSTPTAAYSARPPVTDERPGTYVFMDRQQIALHAGTHDDVSLYVLTTVVASHADGRFVLDAGSKVIGTDRPAWLEGHGFLPAYPDAMVTRLSEHHAVVDARGPGPRVGEVLALVPNHCCVVVNLTDTLWALPHLDRLEPAGVVDSPDLEPWPVISRGYNT
jgi:hypothetical protein